VLTRTTSILGAIFLVLSLGLALINRTPGGTGVESAGRQLSADVDTTWWQEEEEAVPGTNDFDIQVPEGPESPDSIEGESLE
jgi:preprotein translocase subunit SecG